MLFIGSFRSIEFEPVRREIRLENGTSHSSRSADTGKSLKHIPRLELAADSSTDDELLEGELIWEANGRVNAYAIPKGNEKEGWAVIEATWDVNGNPSLRQKSIRLTWDEEESALAGSVKIRRPKSSDDGKVTLLLRPLTGDDLHLLEYEEEDGPSQVTEFLATEEQFEVRCCRRTERGWESESLPPESLKQGDALGLRVTTGQQSASPRSWRTNKSKEQFSSDDPSPDDRTVRELYQLGGDEAFTNAWVIIQPKVHHLLRRKLRSLDAVDDLLQETAARFYKKWADQSFPFDDELPGYAWRIAENFVHQFFRKQKRRRTTAVDPVLLAEQQRERGNGEFVSEEGDQDAVPIEYFRSLKEDEQEYVTQKYRLNESVPSKPLSDDATGESMGLTSSSVRSLGERTVRKLRVLAALEMLDGRLSADDVQQTLWEEKIGATVLSAHVAQQKKRSWKPRLNGVIALYNLVHPERTEQRIVRNPKRPRLCPEQVDLAVWWLLDGRTNPELCDLCRYSEEELTEQQQIVGRRVHAQSLLETSSGELKQAGCEFLKLHVIDGHSLDKTRDEIASRLKKTWDKDWEGLIAKVATIWQPNEKRNQSIVPLEFATFPVNTESLQIAKEVC